MTAVPGIRLREERINGLGGKPEREQIAFPEIGPGFLSFEGYIGAFLRGFVENRAIY